MDLDMLKDYVQMARQMMLAQVSEALNEAYAEAEKLAENADAADEAGKLRRQYLFGKAKGIAVAAGIAAETINRRDGDADHQDGQPGSESAHLALPDEKG